ncbi:MAG: toxic anion resistance protein [Tenericutes bacterium]|nr:toxic anion resistance protein [Mycoplasmatota bacterium]
MNLELKVEDKLKEENISNLTQNSKEVTDEKIEKSLNYDELSESEKKAVDEFITKIDVMDQNLVLQYGAKAQNKISAFSDNILEDVKTKDIGDTGELLANLVGEIKSFNSSIGTSKKGIFKLFNSAKKEISTIIAKYNKIEKNVDIIENSLEKNKVTLLKDIALFDTMYDKNLEYFKEISLYIIAGERKLEELKNKTLPAAKAKFEETHEQLDAQKIQDLENQINRFEKKIYDLKTTRIISIQMAPQIRLLQNNDAELVEKIQSSITNTIPLWKNQMVLALGINNSKKALESQQAVSNLTNDMLKKNSETLKQGSIEIAEEAEKAIIDIETLKKTNQDLIETIDNVIKIHEEGHAKRMEAEAELENIEKELKSKLIEINVPKA